MVPVCVHTVLLCVEALVVLADKWNQPVRNPGSSRGQRWSGAQGSSFSETQSS